MRVSCFNAKGSDASIAITNPRVWRAGDDGPGGASGGEILERTRILPRVGIERIIASRDLACVSTFMVSGWVFWIGASVSGANGWCCVLCGRGGGPMVTGEAMPGPMKSGRGRDCRREWPEMKGKGVPGPLLMRMGTWVALVTRRRLGSGLLRKGRLESGRLLKRGELDVSGVRL